MPEPKTLLAITGSLRRGSYNRALLRAAAELLPEHVQLVEASIELPLYNSDLDGDALPSVVEFKSAVAQCDGVLFATPEYNYGVPGPLKNALDWASRPAYQSVFARKPVGMMGVSTSVVGTARAQGQLKLVLLGMIAQVFPAPEIVLGPGGTLFDPDGRIRDDKTRDRVRGYLEQFVVWADQVSLKRR